jgi:hypothetical protein
MQWIKEMIENCASHHEKCNSTPVSWLPTRLIQVGGPGKLPRLVETSKMPLVPGSPPPRYTTLSHCWGKTETIELTSSNRSRLYDGIPQSTIPKTYADAMVFTSLLGLQYIWIDSLCIVQGDSQDWQHECARIADVYRYGYCNIAALVATDSHGGCFYWQNPPALPPVTITSR